MRGGGVREGNRREERRKRQKWITQVTKRWKEEVRMTVEGRDGRTEKGGRGKTRTGRETGGKEKRKDKKRGITQVTKRWKEEVRMTVGERNGTMENG